MLREISAQKRKIGPRVIGMGLVALDVVFGAEDGSPPECFAGGTCGNVLTVLSFLGWRSEPVSRLDQGQAAELLIQDLRKWNVSDQFISRDPTGKTPIIIEKITRSVHGEPRHRFSWRCPSCGGYLARYRPVVVSAAREMISEMDHTTVFFFDRVSRGALVLAEACRERGALVVFEPSAGVGESRLFHEAWSLADVVKYSHERLRDIADMDLGRNRKGGPVLEVETLGSSGLRYRSRLRNARDLGWVECAAMPAQSPKDTAGAGDWCTAGLIDQIFRNGRTRFLKTSTVELRKALDYGQALASWACEFEGARGGMYEVTRSQLRTKIEHLLTGRETRRGLQRVDREREEVVAGFCAACTDYSVLTARLGRQESSAAQWAFRERPSRGTPRVRVPGTACARPGVPRP